MKPARAVITKLQPFRTWNDHFVLMPRRRFVVFGEGKNGDLRSIVASGRVDLVVDAPTVVDFASVFAGALEPTKARFAPSKKIEFFDKLADAEPLGTCFIPEKKLVEIGQALRDANHTHLRFDCQSGSAVTVRTFDARKYYSNRLSDPTVLKFKDFELTAHPNAKFRFYMRSNVFRQITKEELEFTIFANEIIETLGMTSGVTYTIRDQRLGEKLEERISNLNDYSDIYWFDPDKMEPTKNNFTSPVVQRRKRVRASSQVDPSNSS